MFTAESREHHRMQPARDTTEMYRDRLGEYRTLYYVDHMAPVANGHHGGIHQKHAKQV